MRYEKYELCKLATIKKVKGLPLDKYETGEIPYVTGSQSNNGVVGYVTAPDDAISDGNCIVVDPIKGLCMYQPDNFVGRGFSGASINALYIEGLNELNAMYIIATIEKYSTKVANYGNLFNSNRLSGATIELPTLEELDEESPYSEEGFVPDFDYMEECIKKLKQKQINNLDLFLAKEGLDNFYLTEEDKEILNKDILFKKFKINNIFSKIKTGSINKKAKDFSITKDVINCIPLLTAATTNNGLSRFAKREDCDTILNNVLSVSANGNSGTVFYQPDDFAVLQDAYAINLINGFTFTDNTAIYFACALEKSIKGLFNWSNKAGWEKIKNLTLSLPVIEHKDPYHEYTINDIDFDYMEKYILALKKQSVSKLYNSGFLTKK